MSSSSPVAIGVFFDRGLVFFEAIVAGADPIITQFHYEQQLEAIDCFLSIVIKSADRLTEANMSELQRLALKEFNYLKQQIVSMTQSCHTQASFALLVGAIQSLLAFLKFTEVSVHKVSFDIICNALLPAEVLTSALCLPMLDALVDFCINSTQYQIEPLQFFNVAHISDIRTILQLILTKEHPSDVHRSFSHFTAIVNKISDLSLHSQDRKEAFAKDSFIRFLLQEYEFVCKDDFHPCNRPVLRLIESLGRYDKLSL
jgi:hypothetical protein